MKTSSNSWYQPLIIMQTEDEDEHKITYCIEQAECEPGESQTPDHPGCTPTVTFGKVWVRGDMTQTKIPVSPELRREIEQHILRRAEQD